MLELKYLALLLCLSGRRRARRGSPHISGAARSATAPAPTKIPVYERGSLVVLPAHKDRWLEKNVVKADWDSYGWWEFASLRNFLWYVGGGALTPWLGGLLTVAVSRRGARRGLPAAGAGRTGADVLSLRPSSPRRPTHATLQNNGR